MRALVLQICLIIVARGCFGQDNKRAPQKNNDYSSDYYIYTKPAESIFGNVCIGDCINGTCLVDREGHMDPCRVLENKPTMIYYTSLKRQPNFNVCRSACTGSIPWCYVNEKGNWDYCNKSERKNYDEREYSLRTKEDDISQPCISSCSYSVRWDSNKCFISIEEKTDCAPFPDFSPPILWANMNTDEDPLRKCLIQPSLRNSTCRHSQNQRRKRSDDESDSYDDYGEAACLAAENPDYVDTYRRPDNRNIFGTAAPGTVALDATSLSSRGDRHTNVAPPLTSYTTVRNTDLSLDIPVTVRAMINAAALDAVPLPRPSDGIQRAVPTMLQALRDIRYSVNGIVYDVGHMIGYLSGGPDAEHNFAPQTATLNRGLWLSMENNIRAWVNDGRPNAFVNMDIVIYYDQVQRYLPVAFGVNLIFYYTTNAVASICNDMIYFNQGNRNTRRRPRREGPRE